MILVEGATDSGRLAQVVPTDEAADRLEANLTAVSRNPIAWTRTTVKATDLNAALAEARTARMTTT